MNESGDLLKSLNKEQNDAVSVAPDNHYLVLAGAGCGKTTVLTRRIVFLLLKNFNPHTILGVTFTRKAADEMTGRLVKLLPSASDSLPLLTTFHAFALHLLQSDCAGKQNFRRLGYSTRPVYCNESLRLRLLAESSSKQERQLLGVDLLALDALIEKNSVFPGGSGNFTDEQSHLFGILRDRFQNSKIGKGVWDFSDLVSGAVKIIEECPEVSSQWRERYKVILVDEFQDTNPLQIRLLTLLLGKTGRLFAVGDDDQAIYGFRGADIRPTIRFTEYFPGAEILKLQINYRSVPPILSTANRLFRHKSASYRKTLVSGCYGKKDGTAPSKFMFESDHQLLDWLIMKVDRIRSSEGFAPEEIAVLFRVNQSVFSTKEYFASKAVDQHPQLLTVHASKGLEFPVVFLCDLEEGLFPNYRIPKKAHLRSFRDLVRYSMSSRKRTIVCDWEEELRLFYVAVTRAQKQLYFCAVRHKHIYGRVQRYKASRFLRLV